MEEIIINLHECSNAREFKAKNRVHLREFNKAKQLIEGRIERASSIKCKDKKADSKERYNDTISILGSRGSGKTSFLLSLLAEFKENSKAEVLDIIDPTLIEEKGHIFLTIISLIEESVCNKIDLSSCTPTDSSYQKKKEWKDKLRKLADGLPSMDGIGFGLNDSSWQDAEYIMDKGLKSVKAATNLEDNFNKIVNCALEILDKKAFILTLDDIDVDFRKGWPVLETIRKYLTSPQIIVLLSGDLKLYSKAIRKQQWKNFGKALLKNEAESLNKINSYNDLVTEMESQYIQKVIKPENRIHLTTLLDKTMTYHSEFKMDIKIASKVQTEETPIDIQTYYNKILANLGIKNSYQAEAYSSFLLSLPIRTQIQFLVCFNNEDSDITDAFLNDLYEKEVDVDLAKNMPKLLNVVILRLLIKEQILSEAYQLQPTTTDTSLNSSLIALSFLFSQKVKQNPSLIFDYMIKIGYIRNLLPNIRFADKEYRNVISILKPSIEGLCNHSGIFQDKVLKNIVGNMTAYVESSLNSQEKQTGVIYLYATAAKSKQGDDKSKGRIDYELQGKTSIQQILAFIPLTISQNLTQNSSTVSFSIYTLLGVIGEIYRKIESDDIERGLLELSQIRAYPMISFENGSVRISETNEYEGITITDDTGNIKLSNYLTKWYSIFPKESYSPHLLGKICTRIYYSFNSIQNEPDVDINLAEAIHRRLVALMNAILIEDVRENMPKCHGLNINNAIKVDDIFINNLKFAVENMSNYKFNLSRWILSCPLLLLYLKDKLLSDENLKAFIHPVIDKEKLTDDDWKEDNSTDTKIEDIKIEDLNILVLKKKKVFNILTSVFVQKRKGSFISTLPKFSGAKGKAEKTIAILKNAISYDAFMNSTIKDILEICNDHFAPKIVATSISSLRKYIKENNIEW